MPATSRSKLIQALIVFSVLFLLPLFFLTRKISKINCQLLSGEPCPDELSESLDSIEGRNLVFSKLEVLVSSLETPDGYSLVETSKKLPGQADLIFRQEVSLFLLACDDCDQDTVIGEYRSVLGTQTSANSLSSVHYSLSNDDLFEEKKLRENFFNPVKEVIDFAKNNHLELKNISWISQEEMQLDINNQPKILLSDEDLQKQLKGLEIILDNHINDQVDEEVIEIDMRYKMPVLRTAR